MGKIEEIYYWKCPYCGTEQKVVSAYFMTDCGASERCAKCGSRFHIHHPATPYQKNKEAVIAYEKE